MSREEPTWAQMGLNELEGIDKIFNRVKGFLPASIQSVANFNVYP